MSAWWRSATIYQIYPRSFQDSDGDGVGDLKGIEARLDYLADLGVDAIWISPIFTSPMADFGYDVADYCDVDPLFGTLADFDDLLREAHRRGVKIILDFVPNHSSDRHPWFADSRSSRQAAKRDWYVWRDPAPDGSPPNNWQSFFGGPAWTLDAASGQYYLHQFLKKQPDLNWREPALVEAMLAAMRFWFDRGVDGFRIDVLWLLLEDEAFRDNPPNPAWRPGMQDIERFLPLHTADQPGMAALVARMRSVADEYESRVLIGEIYLPLDRLVAYYGEEGAGVHLPFNFALLQTPWEARAIGRLIEEYEALLPAGGWPNWVLGNHDKPRIAARVGSAQARVAQLLLLTLRGTPTLYQGDELGLTGEPIAAERIRDPQALREPDTAFNRDEVRMPMPWDASPHAGFSTDEPWLPLNADWSARNVAAQEEDVGSMLTLVRRLLALRRENEALATGAIALVEAEGDVLAYRRGDDLLVALNLGATPQRLALPAGRYRTLLSTQGEGADWAAELALAPDEGVILRATG
ncbi:alpha-amylase family glycosyl hydrolase [Sphingomonas bacterium]|uniref:alpha-amylase family glycosyl hydrolase n=1 Tax=Sphingomonas bacterium TaxID=1895847 RepID=UPI001C2DD84D|nr:alpha-amylase family glycosyl hydrolase [Sphingomonas bacterium]